MVVPPSTGGGPSISTFTTANPPLSHHGAAHTPTMNGTGPSHAPKGRMATIKTPKPAHGQEKPPPIPLSARKSAPLNLGHVERRGESTQAPELDKKERPHGLQEAPTYRPSEEEFRNPMEFIRRIAPEASKYGLCRIIPPDNWKPDFAIDTEVRTLSSRLSGRFLPPITSQDPEKVPQLTLF